MTPPAPNIEVMRILLVLLLLPLPAWAGPPPLQLSFAAYVAGFRVFNLQTLTSMSPDDYHVEVGYRTAGVLASFFSGDMHSNVQGQFNQMVAQPQRYMSWGTWFGKGRQTLIDYPEGDPVIRTLVPLVDEAREPVPPEMMPGTVDSLSAVAMLVHRVTQTGRCEGKVRMFDGRRLSETVARTGGMEMLEPDHGSAFAGPALRCDFVGQQLAGFLLDGDQDRMHRPQQGAAWMAAPAPGLPLMPVRILFPVRFFGEGTLYLSEIVSRP